MSQNSILSLLFCFVAILADPCKGDAVLTAECVLQPVNGPDPQGTITLTQNGDSVSVAGQINGLTPPGDHGFHVHDKGEISNGCADAGPHFNPFKVNHGAPTAEIRHVGDLGNIAADESGVANVDITDSMISLKDGDTCVLNRAIVLHAGADDFGKGGAEDSLTTGHAGARLACCVIKSTSSK